MARTRLGSPPAGATPIDLGAGLFAMVPVKQQPSTSKRKGKRKKSDVPAQVGRRGKPYTEADADVLYDHSRPFRSLANRTSLVLDGGMAFGDESAPNEDGRSLARDAADVSTEMAELLAGEAPPERRYFPHPGIVLSWIRAVAQLDPSYAGSDELPSPEMLAALHRGIRSPKVRGKRAWGRFISQLALAADKDPHWFQAKVFAHVPPKQQRAMRGFPLRSITVRIPFGTSVKRNARGQNYFVPARSEMVTIDLTSELARAKFGEMWVATSDDGKGIYLVTTGGRRVLQRDLIELLNLGSTTSQRHAPALPYSNELTVVGSTVPSDMQRELVDAGRRPRQPQHQHVAAVPVNIVTRS